jgi:hypothetical protein
MKEVDMLLDMIEDGQLREDRVIDVLCRWLGREQVRDMMLANGWLDEEEEDYEHDGQPDEAQEWRDFDPEC